MLRASPAALRTAAITLVLAVRAQVAAEEPGIAGRGHLQLQVALVETGKLAGSLDQDGRRFQTRRLQYGLASRLAFGVGYGLTEHWEVLLTSAIAGRASSATYVLGEERRESGTTRLRIIELLPSLRYVPGEGNKRFYFGAGLGYQGERSTNNRNAPGSHTKGFVVGAQAGLYRFVYDRVSLEPGIELAFVKRSVALTTATPESDEATVRGQGTGLQFLFTIGLSAWGGPDTGDAPPPPDVPEHPSSRELRPDQTLMTFATTPFEDFALELAGDPQRSELYLRFRMRGGDVPSCGVALLSDHPPEALDASWYLDGADEEGPISAGIARVLAPQLEHWLATNPSLSFCGRGYLVRGSMLDALQAGLTGFNEAVANLKATEPPPAQATPAGDGPTAP